MKKAKYITNPYINFVLIIVPLIGMLVSLIFKDMWGVILCLCLIFFCGFFLILLRKTLFLKLLIDEKGFKTFYRGNIIKQLNWEDIQDIKAKSNIIFFSDKPLYSDKEEWKNGKEIFVRINSKFVIYLFKYKDKIPVPIKDLDKLSKSIVDKLK